MCKNFSKIEQKRSLVKICPVEVALFQADRQTDRQNDGRVDMLRLTDTFSFQLTEYAVF